MKLLTIALSFLAFVPVILGQGTGLRTTNGVATGTFTITNYASPAYYSLWNGRTQFFGGGISGVSMMRDGGFYSEPTAQIVGGTFHGNGGGLTNLSSATNFPAGPNYVFNGKVTLNSNVYITTLSFPTNRWPGPTNALLLNTNYLNFVASGDCAITNVGGQDATMNTWATVTISNSTASDITVRTYSPGIRLQGASTTAALVIGSGKEGYLSFHCRGVLSTNLVTSTQQ